MSRCFVWFFLIGLLIATAPTARAEEGMWLFNAPPRKLLKEKYGFEPTDVWLEHLQHAAVRITSGGSGEFVSPEGLVMTNHHVGADAMHKLSAKGRDLLRMGFYARTRGEEIPCLDTELNVLFDIEDVTDRVEAAVRSATDSADAAMRRRAEMSAIERESCDRTGLRSDVVSLYRGGQYHLYRYKKYTDVRLVFAPEGGIADFGGDPDNFEYPRYDFDVCFFRVYENGRPARTPNYLKWNPAGLKENDLVFAAGHPGSTERQLTVRHLEYVRDVSLPASLEALRRREVLVSVFGQRSIEHARRAAKMLRSCQNGRKARLGRLDGLQDPAVMAVKRAEEESLRRAAAKKGPETAAALDAALKTIERTLREARSLSPDGGMLEGAQAFQCRLFWIARTLVRMADETVKPNASRLREYRESNLESLRQDLFSEAPIYADLETATLADSLSLYLECEGEAAWTDGQPASKRGDAELMKKIMAGKSPAARAAELVRGTQLADPAVRRRLAEGGRAAIETSGDSMILLARLVDGTARRARAIGEQRIGEPQQRAYETLARLRLALSDGETYPDATFTLRLTFGRVEGYRDGGESIPAWTTVGGLYRSAEEHEFFPPFSLPQRWLDRKNCLDMKTPMNFVFTGDIIGGNSGSPVVNRNGELVGIVFDGDLPALAWDFVYTPGVGRAIGVHGSVILEALRRVYGAGRLADELEGHLADRKRQG